MFAMASRVAMRVIQPLISRIHPLSTPCRSGRNLPKLVFNEATALNTYDVLRADRILMDKASLSFVNTFYGAKNAEAPATA